MLLCPGSDPGPLIEGCSQLHKDQLPQQMCEQLGIETHEHHEVQGIDMAPIKGQSRMSGCAQAQLLVTRPSSERL